MDLSHITSQSLRRVLSLTERKDELVKLIGEIETEISLVLSGTKASATVARPAGKPAPVRKAPVKNSSRAGSLKVKILSALNAAGPQGLRVKEIAEKVGSPSGNISVWLSTTGKKLTTKLEPGLYAIEGAKAPSPTVPTAPAKTTIAPVPKKTVKTAVAKNAKKGGKKPSPLKEKILAILEAAGSQGVRVKDIAAKLGLPGGNVSVWISTTGKNLVTKIEPGLYTAKGVKSPAPATTPAAKPAAPVKAAAPKKSLAKPAGKALKVSKPAIPAKPAFKLSPAKAKK